MKTTSRFHRRRLWLLASTAMGIASLTFIACSGSDGGSNRTPGPTTSSTPGERAFNPVPAVSEIVQGPMHFGLGLIAPDNEPILGTPGTSLKLRFSFADELRQEVDARFLWAIPDETGFWRAEVNFDEAGQWNAVAVLTRAGTESAVRFTFPVLEKGTVPNIGDPAPATENLTLADAPDFKGLSTDRNPEPKLYELTVAEAAGSGRPTLIVFATPAFCETRFCGPVVDNVKDIWRTYGDRVNFIHIEPYQLDNEGGLVSDENGPVAAAPTTEWRLTTEPWVFVLDEQGIIADRYEATVSPDELRQSLDTVLSENGDEP